MVTQHMSKHIRTNVRTYVRRHVGTNVRAHGRTEVGPYVVPLFRMHVRFDLMSERMSEVDARRYSTTHVRLDGRTHARKGARMPEHVTKDHCEEVVILPFWQCTLRGMLLVGLTELGSDVCKESVGSRTHFIENVRCNRAWQVILSRGLQEMGDTCPRGQYPPGAQEAPPKGQRGSS